MKSKKLLIAFFMACGCLTTAFAQTSGNNSPYSRYGYGTLADEGQGFNKGMAGAGLAISGKDVLNRQNPASYAKIDSLTLLFDIGASFTTAHMSMNGKSVNPQNTTVDYVQAGFRLFKNIGFSFGMRPFTTIGYNFVSNRSLDDIDGYGEKVHQATYLGEGGTHMVYGGLGWSPLGRLAIGLNASYLWGDYSHTSRVTFSDATIQSLGRQYSGNISTWLLDFGAQYSLKLNKNNQLGIGLTAGLGHNVRETATLTNRKYTSSASIGSDTITLPNAYEIPMSYGVGLALTHKERLTVSADYTLQMWKDCRYPELVNTPNGQVFQIGNSSFANRQKISIGAQYVPNPEGLVMRDHFIYSAGITYATPYYKINGNNGPKHYGATLGIGLPIFNRDSPKPSILHLTAQYEHVATSQKNYIKEDYFRLCLGLTFNARWFDKWKVQ